MLWNMNFVAPFVRQYVIVIAVNLSVLGAGLGFIWPSPVLVKLFEDDNPVLGRPISDNEASWLVSVIAISCFFAIFLTSYLVDRVGRKTTFILSALPRLIAYTTLYLATSIRMLLIGRLLVGCADGMTFIVVPMYATEIASKDIRGALGIVFQIFSTLGSLTMLSMGPFLSYYTLSRNCLCIVVASSIPLLFLPDSPYFLNKKGKYKEARNVLIFLRGSQSLADEELNQYKKSDSADDSNITLKEVLKSRTMMKALGINICLGLGITLTGFNAVSNYMQTILVSTNTKISSDTASVIIGMIQLFACICTAVVIEKFGRRTILVSSLIGTIVGMIGLGTFFYVMDNDVDIIGFLNYLPLISIVMVVFFYSYGLGALTFLLMSELFEGRARAIGMLFGMAFNTLGVLVVTRAFTPMTKAFGPAVTYWIFGCNSFILVIFILFCVPETKGKTFAEIQQKIKGRAVQQESVIEKC